MAEPTGVTSLYDLILDVAIAADVAYYGSDGQQRAMIPVNEHRFERCFKVVRDGYKRFIHDAPPEGWHWQERDHEQIFGIVQTEGTVDSGGATTLVDDALETAHAADDDINGYYVYDTTQKIQAVVTDYVASGGTVTVAAWLDYLGNSSSLTPAAGDSYSITDVETVAGNKSRYFLPDDFSEIAGDISYLQNSGIGRIDWTSKITIRRMQETTQTSSHPRRASVSPILNRKHELRFEPSPTSAKTITFPYRTGYAKVQAISGLASGGSVTTLVDSSFANRYPDDLFNGQFIYTLDGTGSFGYAVVTDYTGTTGTFTVADWLAVGDKSTAAATDPASGTSYYVTNGIEHTAGLAFDFAVKGAILAEALVEFGITDHDYMGEYQAVVLPRAHNLDGRQQARTRGKMLPGSLRRQSRALQPLDPSRTWTDATHG